MAIVTHLLCLVSGNFFLQWNTINTCLTSLFMVFSKLQRKSEQNRPFLHGRCNLIYFSTDSEALIRTLLKASLLESSLKLHKIASNSMGCKLSHPQGLESRR